MDLIEAEREWVREGVGGQGVADPSLVSFLPPCSRLGSRVTELGSELTPRIQWRLLGVAQRGVVTWKFRSSSSPAGGDAVSTGFPRQG